jgi:hypothetical protein
MPERRPISPESQQKLDTVLMDLAEFTNVYETDVKRAALVAAKILENVEREHAAPGQPFGAPKAPESKPEAKKTPRSKATAAERKPASRSHTKTTAAKKK